jgi:hypothetical protein
MQCGTGKGANRKLPEDTNKGHRMEASGVPLRAVCARAG